MTNFTKHQNKVFFKETEISFPQKPPSELMGTSNSTIIKNSSKKGNKHTQAKFSEYISLDEALDGLKTGKYEKGVIHINPKFPSKSFVVTDSSERDFIITSLVRRNRALDKDEVVVKIKNIREDGRKEAEVVHIINKVHPRTAVGYFKSSDITPNFAFFYPRDKKLPKIGVHELHWPKNSTPEFLQSNIFVVKIFQWDKVKQVKGKITETLGPIGDLKAENSAILREFSIETSDKKFPFSTSKVPREDFRRKCVFTIDNPDTEDMDDALSCQELPNGNYEIGVHISDVGHFVEFGSQLDDHIKEKATSIYFVGTTYNMLPKDLFDLCALKPNEHKVTFSILWEITTDGVIINKKATKSVIKSCARLTYNQAQMLIDPGRIPSKSGIPPIYNGFTIQDLSKAIKSLHKVTQALRKKRKEEYGIRSFRRSGSFSLDETSGEPVELIPEEIMASNELVEELMILANRTVAEIIHKHFPDLILLRIHEGPIASAVSNLQENLEFLGIHIDFSSSKTIQESLDKYNFRDEYNIVLDRLFVRCLQREKYVCAGSLEGNGNFGHFGLGFPIYTHFTSPIRRYADLTTHRLLAACLNNTNVLNWTPQDISQIATICNRQEFQAKRAQAASFDLYWSYFVDQRQPFVQDAVVSWVKENAFDVIILSTGTSVTIYTENFDESWIWKSEKVSVGNKANDKVQWKIHVIFPETGKKKPLKLVVDIFTLVKVELEKIPSVNRLKGRLCKP